MADEKLDKGKADKFNAVGGKTPLDFVMERYAETGDPKDLSMIQILAQHRDQKAWDAKTPVDFVLDRIAAGPGKNDGEMLRALVKARQQPKV